MIRTRFLDQIHVQMPDGSLWTVPVLTVAHHRAKHFARMEGTGPNDAAYRKAYQQEVEFVASDHCADEEILEWARTHMDWADADGHATHKSGNAADNYADQWPKAALSLVQGPDSDPDTLLRLLEASIAQGTVEWTSHTFFCTLCEREAFAARLAILLDRTSTGFDGTDAEVVNTWNVCLSCAHGHDDIAGEHPGHE